MSKNRQIIWMVVLCALHLAAFIWAVRENPEMRDSSEYLHAARNFEQDGDFYCFDKNEPIDMRGYTKRPPLYPFLIFLLRHQHTAILLVQLLVSLISLFLFQRWVLQVSGIKQIKPMGFVLFMCVWAFSFSQYIYAGMVMADLWLQTFTLGLVYLFYRAIETGKYGYWLGISLSLSAALLLKPVMSLWVYVLPLIPLIRYFRNPKKMALLITTLLIPLFLVQFISYQNEQKTGYRHFSSISNINLLHYNTRYTLIAAYGSAEKADSILEPLMVKTDQKALYKSNNEAITRECKKHLTEHFGTYLTLHLKGMVRMFLDPGRFDVYSFFKMDRDDRSGLMEKSVSDNGFLVKYIQNQPKVLLLLLALVLLFNLLKFIAFAIFVFNGNYPGLLRIVFVVAVFYFAGVTGPLGASRFLLPVLPLMAATVLLWPERFKG